MSEAPEFSGLKRCPVCRKEFTVLWPGQWAYKRGTPSNPVYMCTWKCLRQYDKKEGEKHMGTPRKVSEEQEQEAIRIAIEGGDPRPMLKKCGIKNPDVKWYEIKGKVKASDPELYAKIPYIHKKRQPEQEPTLSDSVEGMTDAVNDFFGECEKMGLKLAGDPEPPIEYKVTGIDAEMGNFQYYRKTQYMDWVPVSCPSELVSMNIDEWKQLIRDLPRIMEILGVEL